MNVTGLPLARHRSRRRGARSLCHEEAKQAGGLEILEESSEELWCPARNRDGPVTFIPRRDEPNRQCELPGHWALSEQSLRDVTSALPTTRASDEPVSADVELAEIEELAPLGKGGVSERFESGPAFDVSLMIKVIVD